MRERERELRGILEFRSSAGDFWWVQLGMYGSIQMPGFSHLSIQLVQLVQLLQLKTLLFKNILRPRTNIAILKGEF